MKKMIAIIEVNDNANLSRLEISFKDKNGNNPHATIYRHVKAIPLEEIINEGRKKSR